MSQPYPEHIQASDSNHIPDLSQNILMPSHNPSAYNSFYQSDSNIVGRIERINDINLSGENVKGTGKL